MFSIRCYSRSELLLFETRIASQYGLETRIAAPQRSPHRSERCSRAG